MENSRTQSRPLLFAALFAAGALIVLFLVWKWPTLFSPRAADQREPATLTPDDKRHIMRDLSQSTRTETEMPREEKKAALKALSSTEDDQSLTSQAKLDILTSLNQP